MFMGINYEIINHNYSALYFIFNTNDTYPNPICRVIFWVYPFVLLFTNSNQFQETVYGLNELTIILSFRDSILSSIVLQIKLGNIAFSRIKIKKKKNLIANEIV